MPSPIYRCVINMFVSLPIRKGPGVLMNASAWKHGVLKTRFLDV